MSQRDDARKKAETLKRLREQHKETVARTQARFKDQRAIRRQISDVLHNGPKTVPAVAEATGLPASQVLWHITAMKKYDLVAEAGMCEEYFTYQLIQESKT